MKYKELVIAFDKLRKNKPVKDIALKWNILPSHLMYYRQKAKFTPEDELPEHIARKIK